MRAQGISRWAIAWKRDAPTRPPPPADGRGRLGGGDGSAGDLAMGDRLEEGRPQLLPRPRTVGGGAGILEEGRPHPTSSARSGYAEELGSRRAAPPSTVRGRGRLGGG